MRFLQYVLLVFLFLTIPAYMSFKKALAEFQFNQSFCEFHNEVIRQISPLILNNNWKDEDFKAELESRFTHDLNDELKRLSVIWSMGKIALFPENQIILNNWRDERTTYLTHNQDFIRELKCNESFGVKKILDFIYPEYNLVSEEVSAQFVFNWGNKIKHTAEMLPDLKNQIAMDQKVLCASAQTLSAIKSVETYSYSSCKKECVAQQAFKKLLQLVKNQESNLRENWTKYSMKWGNNRALPSCIVELYKGNLINAELDSLKDLSNQKALFEKNGVLNSL